MTCRFALPDDRRRGTVPRSSTGFAVDRDDAVAGLETGGLRDRSSVQNVPTIDRLLLERRHLRALVEHDRHHDEGEHQVHDRAHHQDLEPLPLRFRQELVGAPVRASSGFSPAIFT